MQSINTLLSFSVFLLLVLFLSVMDNASVNQVAASEHEHQHHMSDFESVDEEPTQQHLHKIELEHPVYFTRITSAYKTDSGFYPSPLFDITVPPPEC